MFLKATSYFLLFIVYVQRATFFRSALSFFSVNHHLAKKNSCSLETAGHFARNLV